MTLHAITWLECPDITWFVHEQRILLHIAGKRVEAAIPLWIKSVERATNGIEVEITLPAPGILLN